jgi:hypothetical protein
MGNVTIQGDLTGASLGGYIGGALNLTTAGAIPYVSAAGILNQDPTAFFWDAANNRLGIGTATPGAPLEVVGQITSGTFTGSVAGSLVVTNAVNITAARLDTASNTGRFRLFNAAGGTETFLSTDGTLSYIKTGNVAIGTTTDDSSNKLQVAGNARFFTSTAAGRILLGGPGDTGDYRGILAQSTTGLSISSINDGSAWLPVFIPSGTSNFIVGGSTNANFKLDVATSGSAGTARFYDQTATTGSTKVVVRAGAGQSTTNLQEWQNSSGTNLANIDSGGNIFGNQVLDNSNAGRINSGGFYAASNKPYGFSSTTSSGGTPDLGIYRNAAGVLEINNGTGGTYRDLILRRSQHNGVTVADLPAAAAGNAGSIQYVTDANATTIGSTVAGGGANKVMVWSDGVAWKIFAS